MLRATEDQAQPPGRRRYTGCVAGLAPARAIWYNRGVSCKAGAFNHGAGAFNHGSTTVPVTPHLCKIFRQRQLRRGDASRGRNAAMKRAVAARASATPGGERSPSGKEQAGGGRGHRIPLGGIIARGQRMSRWTRERPIIRPHAGERVAQLEGAGTGTCPYAHLAPNRRFFCRGGSLCPPPWRGAGIWATRPGA